MYAVIRTGGKQYRVQPGDLLVVEKLDGEPGANIAFADVLMVGEGEAVTVGAPLVEGAKVSATLIETRKGEKVKIFKKIRRQGYRRTRGHRQFQSVLRVTAIAGAGQEAKWDGEVSLTTKAELDARARGLTFVSPADQIAAAAAAKAPKAKAAPPAKQTRAAPKKAKTADEVVASPEVKDAMAAAEVNAPVAEAPAKKAAAPKAEAKKAAAPKAEAKAKAEPKKAAAPKAAAEKKPAAKKAPAAKKKD